MSAVLVVEDEEHLAEGLRFNLEAEGYRVDAVSDGEMATDLLLVKRKRYDAIVLDVMLPGKDGFSVAAELRAAGEFIPILMLTARSSPEDVLRGFEAGADDYLAKPFELAILIARLRGLLRRAAWSRDGSETASSKTNVGGVPDRNAARVERASGSLIDVFVFDGKTIDFGALELRVADRTVRLTVMEAELLRYLVKRASRIISRKAMLKVVWGLHEDTDTRAIDNFIVRLRRHIEDEPSKPKHLLTVRGIGYRFVV